jgi:hypothetical protein
VGLAGLVLTDLWNSDAGAVEWCYQSSVIRAVLSSRPIVFLINAHLKSCLPLGYFLCLCVSSPT